MEKIERYFNINSKDIVSVVGAGGKTSLIFFLAERLGGKVVVTTSTKMFYPKNYNVVFNSKIDFDEKLASEVIVTASSKIDDKIVGINEKIFANRDYDYILIEADGSKMKPLKGWGKNEPVIHYKSNKTIGVIDISTIGMRADKEHIFRLDELENVTKLEKYITMGNLVDIVKNENCLFKHTKNEKILFINKVENQNKINLAKEFSNKIIDFVDWIVIGSVKNMEFEVIKGETCEKNSSC